MVKIKIGVITSAYPEYEDDPHGIFVHRLMREIAKKAHEVCVIAPHTGGKSKYSMDEVQIEKFHYFYPKRFEKLAGRAGMIDNVKEGWFVKFQVFTFLIFNVWYSLLKFRDVDMVHVQWPIPNGLGALFLKKLYGVPYINTIHGEEVYLAKRYHMQFALRWLVNNSSKTVTNSSATRNACVDAGLDEDKLEIIPFGVDTDFFRPMDVPKDEDIFQILSVGYLIERKGHEYLIKAMKEIVNERDDVKLKIVGSGPLEEKLKSLLYDLDLEDKIEILKNVSDVELLNLYNSSDLFVLPSVIDSQGNTEGLGVVLLEAMACGVPVIGSNVGGIPDIIKNNRTGILIPEKDHSFLAKKIIELIKNVNKRNKITSNGFIIITNEFNWKKIAENYFFFYHNI
ncbi:glycosyltransferase [Methanobacterium sp. CWC-01]|uniref:glycosyltransferase n=1 Tax=Methanobacterium aridiramus TaxID=2584467 RepID=UPI002574C616|nr:glycosyltransferase [Methanobacterium sp. CWC-01]